MPGRHRHPVQRDEATGDCQDEGGAGSFPVILHPVQLHQLGDDQLLPGDHQTNRSPHPQGCQEDQGHLPVRQNQTPQTQGESSSGEEGHGQAAKLQRHEECIYALHGQRP